MASRHLRRDVSFALVQRLRSEVAIFPPEHRDLALVAISSDLLAVASESLSDPGVFSESDLERILVLRELAREVLSAVENPLLRAVAATEAADELREDRPTARLARRGSPEWLARSLAAGFFWASVSLGIGFAAWFVFRWLAGLLDEVLRGGAF